MTTTVVNLRHNVHDVYIGRPGKGKEGPFGNPIRLGAYCSECRRWHRERGDTIECFRSYFLRRVDSDPTFRQDVLALRGKRLGCFCKPQRCHGDVIAAWVDAQPVEAP